MTNGGLHKRAQFFLKKTLQLQSAKVERMFVPLGDIRHI